MEQNRTKFQCQHPGCNRSYFRSEHLNRHTLIHKKGAFICYLCQRRFTRNDLLTAHLRRHEKRGHSLTNYAASQDTGTTSVPAPVTLSQDQQTAVSGSPPTTPTTPPGDWRRDQTHPAEASSSSLQYDTRPLTSHFPSNLAHSLPHNDASHMPHYAPPSGSVSQHSTSSGSPLPSALPQQPFITGPAPYQDYTWLFHGASLFDLPSNDYLDLHFGQTLDHNPAPELYNSIDNEIPQYDKLEITPALHESLVEDCCGLLASPLNDIALTNRALLLALDYCDIYMPLFHRPTLKLDSCPLILIHALCSLGAFLSGAPELYNTATMLHKHVWALTVEKALATARVEMPFLQALIIIEHICCYSMTRQDHEMAEIAHGIIVTLARRNNLMTESHRKESSSRQSLDIKWKEWAQRESVIRIAHSIFVADVQYMVYFSHHALLSVSMMKIPLPSHPSLWDATTAADWEIQLRNLKKSSRSRYYCLDSAVESIMSMKDFAQRKEFQQCFYPPNPLSLHILIHGIVSAIGDSKYRSIGSSTTFMTQGLKTSDFDDALNCWRSHFEQLPESEQKCKLSWCALIMYHFSTVLLRNSLPDIQMAAGSAFSSGRAVTPQGAQAAYTRLISNNIVSHDTYLHGLEVVSLCLQDGDGNAPAGASQARPLWQTYGAFLGTLVLWARTVGLEKQEQSRDRSIAGPRPFGSVSISSPAANILSKMQYREQSQSEAAMAEVRVLKGELQELIQMVCHQLTARPWEISHEAARILSSLGQREGSRPTVNNSINS